MATGTPKASITRKLRNPRSVVHASTTGSTRTSAPVRRGAGTPANSTSTSSASTRAG
jgi:hypothetical protein